MNIISELIGAVVIGRNEGKRLARSLLSIQNQTDKIIYVDSGSTDNSCRLAEEIGVDVLKLDPTFPYSAAIARNEGFAELTKKYPKIQFVQFVDGDCVLCKNWINEAINYLETNLTSAIVCGILQEEFPNQSIFNRLCDIEWDQPVGEVGSCGGIFLIRRIAFEQVSGFNTAFIAGEEPEMCLRLIEANWRISRISKQMAFHDADMSSIFQYIQRIKRSGHATACSFILRPYINLRKIISILFWGCVLPVSFLATLFYSPILAISIFFIFVFQIARVMLKLPVSHSMADRITFSIFIVFGKIFEIFGLFQRLFIIYKKTNCG